MLAQTHLEPQTLENFDINKVTPLNPEIISRQATINIGTIGHVAHGKSTLVRAVSEQNVSVTALNKTCLIQSCIDCTSLQRAVQKYYNQTWICERQTLQMPIMPTSSVLQIIWLIQA